MIDTQQQTRITNLFTGADKDADGNITKDEFAKALAGEKSISTTGDNNELDALWTTAVSLLQNNSGTSLNLADIKSKIATLAAPLYAQLEGAVKTKQDGSTFTDEELEERMDWLDTVTATSSGSDDDSNGDGNNSSGNKQPQNYTTASY